MKKLYLILLMLLLLFIPTSVNAVAIYQLDQPIKDLNNYTLRQVFANRNMARPNLSSVIDLGDGWYEYYRPPSGNGLVKYNINTGEVDISGLFTSTGGMTLIRFDFPLGDYTFKVYDRVGNVGGIEVIGQTTNYYGLTAFDNGLSLTNKNAWRIYLYNTSATINVSFKIQIEAGSIATPYQVPTSGPYNQFDFGWLDLTPEQIQTYYNLYLEAVRFEQENIEAGQDNGGYQNIFKAIINGVKNLMVEMGYVWQWLNAPIITSDMSNYQFNIDWSWDLIGVVRQILNSAGILVLQITFWVPSLAFSFMGIPVHISVLSLLFSNLIFLLLGWIMVKSFLI